MTTATTSVQERVDGLISSINQGKILEAMTEFYADDVTMRENSAEPTVGLAANIEREKQFLASVKEWKWTRWDAIAVNEPDGVSILEYAFQFVNTDGQTVTYEQATVQRWRDGKIVAERFYHG
ncbi:MAG: nuclear transport factor 2 family protein [Phycisphaerales bacterium]